MEDLKNSSPLLMKYLRAYEQNRSSRVFAPLAETYRKLGRLDEAFRLLKEGIRKHPTYTLGYLVLANCYFDKNQFEFAYNTLRPLVNDNLDNVGLQRLFAETCEKLLYIEEALETYKYLLFLNPKDQDISSKVSQLEEEILKDKSSYLILSEPIKNQAQEAIQSDDDNWVQINLSERNVNKIESKPIPLDELGSHGNDWSMSKSHELKIVDQSFFDESKAIESTEHESDEEYDDSLDPEFIENFAETTPVMTLTLVDIYCAQKLFVKAEEVLEKILEISPHDARIQAKLKEVKALNLEHEKASETREDLMSVYDARMQTSKEKIKLLEDKFYLFLQKLRIESQSQT